MTTIAANLQAVRAHIAQACLRSGRDPATVTLLAVTKGWPAAVLREAIAAGQSAFGESYLQEAQGKIEALADGALDWHFIGPLQSNKTRPVAERFAWVHSVERLKIAERLSAQRPAGMAPLQVCLQVNVSDEVSKSGCAPEQAVAIAAAIAVLPGLTLRGLMAIPAPTEDTAQQRRQFGVLRHTLERINGECGLALDTLSMGMSHDMEAAIIEGATLVRVGTAIFGERTPAIPPPLPPGRGD